MSKLTNKVEARAQRRARVRRKVQGTDEKPRLCVFRSLRFTYVQLISDETGGVLGCASTKDVTGEKSPGSVETAKLLGQKIAEIAKSKDIDSVVFDRNGYLFHGRVAAVAAGAREAGLKF